MRPPVSSPGIRNCRIPLLTSHLFGRMMRTTKRVACLVRRLRLSILGRMGDNHMKPEIASEWKKALIQYERAKQYVTAGEHDAAKTAVKECVKVAACATMEFSRGNTGKMLSLVTTPAYEAICFDWERHCSRPCDYVREAHRLLMTLRNSLPPESDLPLPS